MQKHSACAKTSSSSPAWGSNWNTWLSHVRELAVLLRLICGSLKVMRSCHRLKRLPKISLMRSNCGGSLGHERHPHDRHGNHPSGTSEVAVSLGWSWYGYGWSPSNLQAAASADVSFFQAAQEAGLFEEAAKHTEMCCQFGSYRQFGLHCIILYACIFLQLRPMLSAAAFPLLLS